MGGVPGGSHHAFDRAWHGHDQWRSDRLTRVPDIVVTLAMLFVWEGTALLILNAPGGTVHDWLEDSIAGSVLFWVPRR
jgi:hypothetical protein